MNINSTLIVQLVVFAILIWFTMKFVWPPIAKALDERAGKIAEGLAAAERGRTDFEQSEKKAAEVLAEGRQQVAEIIANADKRAAQITENAKLKAEEEANRILSQAKSDLEQEFVGAKEMLRSQVADLAIQGAEKILRREINADNYADILTRLKQEL